MPDTIFIYDEIGPESFGMVSARYVVDELKKSAGRPVQVRINSPGGSVFEAHAIYNALKMHTAGVDVVIDALAASAASYVAMAGRTVSIAKNAMFMVHEPYTITVGGAAEHASAMELLRKSKDTIVDIYMDRIGEKTTRDEVLAMIEAETWLTAEESIRYGFADELTPASGIAANVRRDRFRNVPKNLIEEGEKQEKKQANTYNNRLRIQERLTQSRS